MPKTKQITVSYAGMVDSSKKSKPSGPPGLVMSHSNAKASSEKAKNLAVRESQPLSINMDTQTSCKHDDNKDGPAPPALKLFELIESFKRSTQQTRKRAVSDVLYGSHDENAKENVIPVLKVPIGYSITAPSSSQGPSNKRKAPASDHSAVKRHIIAGTGRVAYSGRVERPEDEEVSVRVIYRLTRADNKQHQTVAQTHMEWREFVITAVEEEESVAMETPADEVTKTAQGITDLSLSKATAPPVEAEPAKKVDKPLFPSKNSSTFAASSRSQSTGVSSSTTAAPRSNPYLNTKAAPVTQAQHGAQVGVGTTGRAAAMAKMAALGQEWAEEEELPGFGPPAGGSSLNRGGGLSKAVSKEVAKEAQRGQKIKAAKRG